MVKNVNVSQSWSIVGGLHFTSSHVHNAEKVSNTRLQWEVIWAFIGVADMLSNYRKLSITDKNVLLFCFSFFFYSLSAWAFIFLSQSFWWSEKPCLPLLKELGPADVGVSLKRQQISQSKLKQTHARRLGQHIMRNKATAIYLKIIHILIKEKSEETCMYECVYTCQCSSSSSLLLEASPQVHSTWQEKVKWACAYSLFYFFMYFYNHDFTVCMHTYIIIFIKHRCQPCLFWREWWYRFLGFLEQVGENSPTLHIITSLS